MRAVEEQWRRCNIRMVKLTKQMEDTADYSTAVSSTSKVNTHPVPDQHEIRDGCELSEMAVNVLYRSVAAACKEQPLSEHTGRLEHTDWTG